MIVGYVVNALLACIDALVSLFPTWNVGSQPGNDGITSWLQYANGIVPVHTTVTCLLLGLGLLVAMRTWDAGVWVFHQFWGAS